MATVRPYWSRPVLEQVTGRGIASSMPTSAAAAELTALVEIALLVAAKLV
jgi:hypothetical protein